MNDKAFVWPFPSNDISKEEDDEFDRVKRENAMREVQRLGQEIEGQPYHFECETVELKRTWVGLTPDEIDEIIEDAIDPMDALLQTMDKLKEKNT